MRVLRRLVLVATLAGLLSGALLTLVHQAVAVPLILRAEVLEEAGAPHTGPHGGGATVARLASTALAQSLAAIGFSLLLLSGSIVSRSRLDARRGLAWGLAGFAVFFLAPALGLPPTLPGTQEAALPARQLWWLLTVLFTGAGLALAVFGGRWFLLAAGAVLVLLPHVLGAPHPAEQASLAPVEGSLRSVVAAALANLLFWLVLGALTGFLQSRIGGEGR